MSPLLIVTPTYNEVDNIGQLLRQIHALGLDASYMVIDDGSTDGTGTLVEGLRAEMPTLTLMQRGAKLGVGSAHLTALKFAKDRGYQTLVTLDADFSHQPSDIPRLLALAKTNDVVLGTRFAEKDSLNEWTLFRKGMTHLGHFLTRFLLGIPYDASGGLRVYNLNRLSTALLDSIESTDYDFFFESIALIHEHGHKIGEVPVRLPARTYGHSKMQLKHAVKGLLKLFALSIKLSARRSLRRAAPTTRSSTNG